MVSLLAWRSHRMWQAPYRRRWLVLVATTLTIACLAVWGASAGGAPHPVLPTTTPAPTSEKTPEPGLVTTAAGDGKVVALTFDDGPHPAYTAKVLDLLARHGATATFCMVGNQAAQHPDLVRRVAEAGMRLCAHSVTHDAELRTRAESVIDAEIAGSRAVLVAAAHREVAVEHFRAPAGHWSEALEAAAARHGMRSLSWSVDSRDWTRPGADAVVTAVQQGVRPGGVVLLHDGGGQRDQTITALEVLLPWFVEQGYTFGYPA